MTALFGEDFDRPRRAFVRSAVLVLAAAAAAQAQQATPVFHGQPWRGPGTTNQNPSGMSITSTGPGNYVCSTTPHLNYYQGPVVSNAIVVPVNWNGNVNNQVTQNITQFYADLANSSYIDSMGEYSTSPQAGGTGQWIGYGTAAATVTISPVKCPTTSSTSTCRLSDADIQTELTRQINLGVLPAPTLDATGNSKTYYPINFGPYVQVTGPGVGTSCVSGGFCAYHNTGTYGSSSTPLLYGALMDTFTGACSEGCGSSSNGLQNYTSVAGHEFAETITDADIGLDIQSSYANPAAWGDNNCGEIADICDNGNLNTITVGGRSWNVQSLWSNQRSACVISGIPGRPTPAIAWSTPAPITYPTPLSSTQLDASTTVAGGFAYNPGAGTVLNPGPQTLNTTFTPNNLAIYTTATDSVSLTVNNACVPITSCPVNACGNISNGCGGTLYCGPCAATPVINWATPAPIVFGSALGSAQLKATASDPSTTASVPGTFVYTPPAGTVLPIGNGQTLSVTFTPTNTTNYNSTSGNTTIDVTGASSPGSPANLVVTSVLSRSNGIVTVELTIANNGGSTAANVTLNSVKVGGVAAATTPQALGSLAAGAIVQATVTVPGTVGASGAPSSLAIGGAYTGGSFNSSARITLP